VWSFVVVFLLHDDDDKLTATKHLHVCVCVTCFSLDPPPPPPPPLATEECATFALPSPIATLYEGSSCARRMLRKRRTANKQSEEATKP